MSVTPRPNYIQTDGEVPYFSSPEAACIDLEYPAKLERIPFFARCLATIGYEVQDFAGALIWFSEWGVWNAQDEASGYRIVEAFHAAAGQPCSFEAGLGHSFRADELCETTAMLLQPIVFGWDAFFIPAWNYGSDEFFVYVSHDSYATIVTRTKQFHDKVFAILKAVDLDPKPSPDSQLQRFCRP